MSLIVEYMIGNTPSRKDKDRYQPCAKLMVRSNACHDLAAADAFSKNFSWAKVTLPATRLDGDKYGLHWLKAQLQHFGASGVGTREARRCLDFIIDMLPTQWTKDRSLLDVIEDYHSSVPKSARSKADKMYKTKMVEINSIRNSYSDFIKDSSKMYRGSEGSRTEEYQKLMRLVLAKSKPLFKEVMKGMHAVEPAVSTGPESRHRGRKLNVIIPTNPNLNINDKVNYKNTYTATSKLIYRTDV